ncbi:MAG: NUDIX hydrolase [Chloroflexi bacterium]|nr:NUDIX hydrolase [Chloroflexota bacterium]
MQPWKTLSRRTILNHSRFLSVESHTVQLPDGQQISDWPWIITPDYINVVAVTTEGLFLCFRQSKYGVEGGITLAPVGGYIEPGEDPLAAARRELREETGYEAPDWQHLGNFAVDGNRGVATAHLFLAQNARYIIPADADDLEEQELLLMRHAEVEQALMAGAFKCVPWTAALALALRIIDDS